MHTTLKLASPFQQGNATGDYVGAHLCSCARCRYVCARYLLFDALLPRGVHLRFILSWVRYGWLAYMRDSFYDVQPATPRSTVIASGDYAFYTSLVWAKLNTIRPGPARPERRADGPSQRRRWLRGFFLVCWSSDLGFDSLGGNWPLHLCPGRPRNRVRLLP